MSEKLTFVGAFSEGVAYVDVANRVANDIDVLGQTKDASELRTMIKESCVPRLTSCKCEFKETCLILIHTLVTIEKYRDITMTNLINILQSTSLRQTNKGYLVVQNNRRNKLKSWIDTTLLSNEKIACTISYHRDTQYWPSKEHQLEVDDFITYIGLSLRSKFDNISESICQEHCRYKGIFFIQ